MAKKTINLGTPPSGFGGDTARAAFEKVNSNFDELYSGAPLRASTAEAVAGANNVKFVTPVGAHAAVAAKVEEHEAQANPHPQYLADTVYERNRLREALLKEATLSLDFANNDYRVYEGLSAGVVKKPLSEILSISRASAATGETATGQVATAGVDQPRLVWSGGKPQGLLVEEQRTNLLLHSNNVAADAWMKIDVFFWEVLDSPVASPIAGQQFNRVRVTQDVASETLLWHQTLPLTVGQNYTFSFYVGKEFQDLTYLQVDTEDSIRTVINVPECSPIYLGSNVINCEVWDRGTYYEIAVTFTVTKNASRVGVMPMSHSSIGYNKQYTTGQFCDVAGFQLEPGDRRSSYISTQDAQVTRAADNVRRTLGQEFNANEGVIYTELKLRKNEGGGNPNAWCATNNNIRAEFDRGALRLTLDLRGSGHGFNVTGLYGTEGVNRLAVSYKDGEIIAALNGELESLQVNETLGYWVNGLYIGSRGTGNYINAPVGNFSYLPHALSEAELIALTTPEAS